MCRTDEIQNRCFPSPSYLGDDVLVIEVDGVGWVGPVIFQPVLVNTLGVKVYDDPQKINKVFNVMNIVSKSNRAMGTSIVFSSNAIFALMCRESMGPQKTLLVIQADSIGSVIHQSRLVPSQKKL